MLGYLLMRLQQLLPSFLGKSADTWVQNVGAGRVVNKPSQMEEPPRQGLLHDQGNEAQLCSDCGVEHDQRSYKRKASIHNQSFLESGAGLQYMALSLCFLRIME